MGITSFTNKLLIGIVCIQCEAANLNTFLNAIAKVESKNNDAAIGDSGRAIGRFQIHKSYFLDSQQFGKTTYNYTDCTNRAVARKVVINYLTRYGAEAIKGKDWETLARLHNGGPNWKKKNTDKYWKKIKIELEK